MKEGIEFRLQIETCTICNAKCNFCPYPTKVRDKTIMPMALFKKIIDEAATTAHRFDVVILSGIGEPLLDKLLDERVAYVKKNLPKARITIFNNGSLLYPERFETLKRLGVEDFVKFSSIAVLSSATMSDLGPAAVIIARAEGLEAHARAVEKRLENA